MAVDHVYHTCFVSGLFMMICQGMYNSPSGKLYFHGHDFVFTLLPACYRYTCCAGYMPCSGRCGESKCPELCLCTEVCNS